MELNRDEVLAAYDDGVAGVQTSIAAISDWSSPTPCAAWTALDIAGHLLAITRYYHRLLDAALVDQPLANLPRGPRLQAMNDADLAALSPDSGPNRITQFVSAAQRYRLRLTDADWELVLGSWEGLGPLTLGQHTGLAVVEWHVHAWDLGRAGGHEHHPSSCHVLATGARALPDPLPEGDPWIATLRWTGRAVK